MCPMDKGVGDDCILEMDVPSVENAGIRDSLFLLTPSSWAIRIKAISIRICFLFTYLLHKHLVIQ